MLLRSISVQHFRNYKQSAFHFSKDTTVIIGPNAAGKSNLVEAINLLSSGTSFRAERDTQMIQFGESLARVKGQITKDSEKDTLEVVIVDNIQSSARSFTKKLLVNNLSKRRADFAGILPILLFVPSDLDIIISSPSHRRKFLDAVLETVDRQYRLCSIAYDKALRQRNALLGIVKETGVRNHEQFIYWDNLLIENGSYLTKKREELINYLNTHEQSLLKCQTTYDKSTVSQERLKQYLGPEVASGVTLVGPHRDDFSVDIIKNGEKRNAKSYGSRGQQRLVVLQLKLLQLAYMEEVLGQRPLLLLDDIFSELDKEHIQDVLKIITKQQTILTTTHKEFLASKIDKEVEKIELSL